MYLVSGCLLGMPCRYDGKSKADPAVIQFLQGKTYCPICPECLGGLIAPRPPAELCGGDGAAVLAGTATVKNAAGQDVTAAFLAGAQKVLAIAQQEKPEGILLKANSPSCGTEMIYDGSFRRILRPGLGVTAALLQQTGYILLSEKNIYKSS